MKKILSFLIAAIMLLALSIPAFASNSGLTLPSSVTVNSADEELTEAEVADSADDTGDIEEQVLYDDNGFKITLKSMDLDRGSSVELGLLIENSCGKDAIVQCEDISVNGYMASGYLYSQIPDGKKKVDSFSIFKDNFELCGITDVADIEFVFRIIEQGSYDEIVTTEPIVITTDIADSFEYVYDDSGIPAYEGSDVKLVIKGLAPNENNTAQCLYFFAENKRESGIVIRAEDISINGLMVSGYLWSEVNSNKYAVDCIEFYKETLEESGVDGAIEELELTFRVIDAESLEEVFTTDPITINF